MENGAWKKSPLDTSFGFALAVDARPPLPPTAHTCFYSKPVKKSIDLYRREFRMNLSFYKKNQQMRDRDMMQTNPEAYLQAPGVITHPGINYGSKRRAFQGIASLTCGGGGRGGGRLWAVWYGGVTPGEDKNNYIILAVSEDGGQTWSEEKCIVEHEADQVRCFDPEIWLGPDDRLWLFWAQHPSDNRMASLSGVWAITANEADGPETQWSAPRRLCDGVMMCKPLVLTSGEWALPVSFWHRREQGSAAIVVSTDQGQTWSERGSVSVPPKHRNHDEHMLVELRDGRLCMLVRTKYGIGESVSENGGHSWSLLEPAAIPHASSRFFIRRLASGNLLLVRHAPADEAYAGWHANAFSQGRRSHLTAFLSADDGRTWPHRLPLDDRTGISYPDGDQAEDGTIHITYDYDRQGAREILLASFREADLIAGDASADTVRLRTSINTARPYQVMPEDIPNRGIRFVDHQKQCRSGHGGNCLTECTNGDIVAFYSNVSGEQHRGHGTYGWSEYRRSTDGGRTWSEPTVLDYSKRVYEGDEMGSALVFAATTAPDGTLVAFVSHFAAEGLWVKQATPSVLLSDDHGHTWSEPRPLDPDATVEEVSLTFDAVFVRDGKIYIVYMGGSANFCPGPYALYVSADNGATFERRGELRFDPENYYVTAGVLDSGEIIVYAYPYRPGKGVQINEHDIPYLTSADDGRSWSEVKTTRFAKRIRNPQMSEKIGGWYFLHGRSGSQGATGEEKGNFVLYASRDGVHWDAGTLLYRQTIGGGDCYSANAVVGRHRPDDAERLLIQSSIAYEEGSARVNECHWWVEPKSDTTKS